MANTANPMKEMVDIFIPIVSGEENTVFVGLNGKAWQIPRGKREKVPKPVAEIVERSQNNTTKQHMYKQHLTEIYDKSRGAN